MNDIHARVKGAFRTVQDFPKPGIEFIDLMPLLADPVLFNDLCDAIVADVRQQGFPITSVAACEARGFLFGPMLAVKLGVPFFPIRKKGKLPGRVRQETYALEYGTDSIEIQEGAAAKGDHVLLFDDLLATGGTLTAAANLISHSGAQVSAFYVIVELPALKGRDRLTSTHPNTPLLSFVPW